MAGAGYKLFTTGSVLTAADVNTYLNEQSVMRFANAAARTSALTSVLAEGMVSYLQDTDSVEVYNGTAWVSIGSSGDITGITTGATSGLTGGVTSGTADLKLNTTAKGGLLVGTGSGTVTELAVGTNNYILTADSSTASGLKWAAAAGGGKVLQVLSTIKSSTFTTTSSTPTDVTDLSVTITPSATSSKILVHYNLALYNYVGVGISFMNLVRGSTALSQGTADGSRTVATGGIDGTNTYGPQPAIAGNFLDSPSTTSATTYKIQVWAPNGSQTSVNRSYEDSNQSNRPRFASVITVMEIGA